MKKIYIKEISSCSECPGLSVGTFINEDTKYCTIHPLKIAISDSFKIPKKCPLESINFSGEIDTIGYKE